MTEVFRKLTPVPFIQVSIEDTFWLPRLIKNHEISIPQQIRMCEETGRIENFKKVTRGEQGTYIGKRFNDSDVYKWIETACYSIALFPDTPLEKKMTMINLNKNVPPDLKLFFPTFPKSILFILTLF